MKRGTAIAANTPIERLEPRIQFTELTSLGWGYRLPAGYGAASVTYDVANLEDSGVSGTLRLELHLAQQPVSGFGSGNGTIIASEAALSGVEAGAHALRSASQFFDMDSLTPGSTFYINAFLTERTPGGAIVRVASETLETLTIPTDGPFRGQTGASHDGAINGFDAGDTQADATAATPLPFTSRLEEIARRDVDYYEFTLGVENTVTASLNDPGGTLAFALLDDTGALLAQAPARTPPEDGIDAPAARIVRTLPAGTYALRVTTTEATDRAEYTVEVSAVVPTAPPPPDPFGTARGLGAPPNTQLNEQTTAEDLDDHFSFTLPQRSSVTVELGELSADLDVELLYANGGVAARAETAGATTERMTRVLEVGTYYLRVYGDAAATYSLRVNSTPAPGQTPTPTPTPGDDDDEAAIANARDLGTLPATAVSGDVRDGHPADAYKFTLPARSRVDAVLGDLSSPVEIALLKDTGSAVTRTRKSDASERTLSRTLAAGTYYVLVFRGTGSTTGSGYTLALQTNQLEAPGGGGGGGGGGAPNTPVGPPDAAFKGAKSARKAYRFTVTYSDPDRITESTVGPDDILVTGPNGFSRTASILRTKVARGGTRISATYVIDPPNGTWFSNENGTYQVNLQPGTITDAAGTAVAGGALGAFVVSSKKAAPASAPLFTSTPIEVTSDSRGHDDDDGNDVLPLSL